MHTPQLIIEARIRILREVRERVRDDFLIIVNANRKKPIEYAEYVNGSAMEPGEDYKGTAGGTYKLLQELDETLLWNEENLRQPTVNWGEGFLLPDQPPNRPDNQRRMRLFTARGLTHSDGYVHLAYAAGSWQKWMDTHNFWYSFWDADLGKPIGKKGNSVIIVKVFLSGSSPTAGQFTTAAESPKKFSSRCKPPV